MVITVLIDTPDSFLHEYVSILLKELRARNHDLKFIIDPMDIRKGKILILLGCSTILSKKQLSYNEHNLVVHPSKLPEGRGSAALIWKILNGQNKIYITLFEAFEKVDTGDFYFQESIEFEGHELSDEIRRKQAHKTIELALKFIDNYPNVEKKPQIGQSSFLPKRKPKDSELDINKTILEQFNLLRVVDNNRYPAFFIHKGYKYYIKILQEKV